jgi:ferredoxin-NADP reductase
MSTRTQLPGALRVLDMLAYPHGLDRYTELVRPLWSRHDLRAEITTVNRGTADSVTLTLRPNRGWTGFVAGQHTQVGVEIDGVRHRRCYSLAGSAHRRDGLVEVTIGVHPGGRVSSHLASWARPGAVVDLTPAQGDFRLPDERPDRLLLVSGGSGITPVMSMLRTLCDEGHDAPVTFLHYAPAPEAMIYRREVEELAERHANVRVVRSFTRRPGAGDLDGRFSAAHLEDAEPRWREAEAYVCGPAGMRDAVVSNYAVAGLAGQVHQEAFTPPVVDVADGHAGGTLRFTASGSAVANDGRLLLDQAESAGINPTYGCRMGICHTCTRRLCRGTVRHAITGALTTDADVDVQLCTNVPVGDVEIDL